MNTIRNFPLKLKEGDMWPKNFVKRRKLLNLSKKFFLKKQPLNFFMKSSNSIKKNIRITNREFFSKFNFRKKRLNYKLKIQKPNSIVSF